MKTFIRRTALTSMALLFLLSGASAALAEQGGHQDQTQAQTLNATMTGGVVNLGTQTYTVKGGQVAFAAIAGQLVDPTTATLKYNFQATQEGLSTKGSAHIQFTGTTTSGVSVSVSGRFDISSNVPATELPAGCTTNCQSALPFFFVGSSSEVKMTVGTSTQTVAETLQIESPYFNPGGMPIVLASTDNSIVIAATYTQGTIRWDSSTVGGAITGTLGSTPASGMFSMTTSELENLVTGTATDSGKISFSSMTPTSLNAKGDYTGTSTIPTAGAFDCSGTTGIPGTCTETGFQSTGKFTMNSNGNGNGNNDKGNGNAGITGTYSTTWGVPALGFVSSVSATVSQNGNSNQGD
jgi:hypothetical protein